MATRTAPEEQQGAAPHHRPGPSRRWAVPAIAVLVGAFIVLAVALLPEPGLHVERLDFSVYWGAIRLWMAGGSLYDFSTVDMYGQVLPFVYPPFAALALSPLGLLTLARAALLWSLVQLCLTGVLALAVTRTAASRPGPTAWDRRRRYLLVFLGLIASNPVAHSTELGQLSLLVVVLVVVDVVFVPPRWRGVLIGVAAAIKLTPLIFVPYLLVTRQWANAARATGTFAVAGILGAVVMPAESWHYWTQLAFDSTRMGEVSWLRNKSLRGFLAYWNLGGPYQTQIWAVLAVVVLVLGLWTAWRHHARGEEYRAILVVGILATIVSPISWTHHLIWLVLAWFVLALGARRWERITGVVLVLSAFYYSPPWAPVQDGPVWLAVLGALPLVASLVMVTLGFPGATPRITKAERPHDRPVTP